MSTDDVIMASTAADANTLEQQRDAVTELLGRMTAHEQAVFRAGDATGTGFDDAHRAVVDFTAFQVAPWLTAAEHRLLPGAADLDRTRLLTEGLLGQLRMIEQAAARIAGAGTGIGADRVRIISDIGALRVLLEVFFGTTTELLMPALAEAPTVNLTCLVENLPTATIRTGGCACGEHDPDIPELDVRTIPHAIRHATVFGAFDAVTPGESMILIAHHDPIPLLRQLAQRTDGHLEVTYEQRGPEAWRLMLTRL
ncbi:DUF2249 domain-containing protein [Prescottella subtropica]|uniref:DUF2249 domain-containing protein n=1 Tax=Prescottella subtropica TaxID=2545757 RepID=UPI0010F47539|nr:DUF2249 domain-containing protein [Prescottella subtropica]